MFQVSPPTALTDDTSTPFAVKMKYTEVLVLQSPNFQIDTFVNEDILGIPSEFSYLKSFSF